MVWGVDWTGERVAERLVAAFRAMPGISIYSPSKGVFEPSRPIDGLELITVVQLCLGRESRECRDLLTWARLKAKAGDVSIREHFRQAGRNRKSFYYRRDRDLDRVAAFLNEQRAGKMICQLK
jgi:hypothetical protein